MFNWSKESGILLYHGTNNPNLKPRYGLGREDCDYGRGFYLTEDEKIAKDWSYIIYLSGDMTEDKFVYSYLLNTDNLKTVDLNGMGFLTWVSTLLKFRKVGELENTKKSDLDKFIDHYSVDVDNYDLIKGYRVDDGYFRYVKLFLEDLLTLEELNEIFLLGGLGDQYCLKSKLAYDSLKHIDREIVGKEYSGLIDGKYEEANRIAKNIQKRKSLRERIESGTMFSDILRGV